MVKRMERKRVAIYCRVAREDTFALEAQTAELRRYAERNGYTIVAVQEESGSGLTLDRPALAEVTRAVCEGRVDIVLIKKLSRIGREWGMVQSYIQLLNEHKVTLLCVSEGLEISNRNLYPRFGHKKAECP